MPENIGTPRHSPLRIVLLLAALAVGGGLLLFASQNGSDDSSPTPITPAPPVDNSASNSAGNIVDEEPEPATITLFVPNDNAMLSRETITDESTPETAPYGRKANRALELLFERLEFLPKGTRILDQPRKLEDGTVRVNLSKEFMELDSEHETPVLLVLDSMSSTLGAVDSEDDEPGEPARMRVAVEGKPVSVLSQFTLEDPWKASKYEQPSHAEEAA